MSFDEIKHRATCIVITHAFFKLPAARSKSSSYSTQRGYSRRVAHLLPIALSYGRKWAEKEEVIDAEVLQTYLLRDGTVSRQEPI